MAMTKQQQQQHLLGVIRKHFDLAIKHTYAGNEMKSSEACNMVEQALDLLEKGIKAEKPPPP